LTSPWAFTTFRSVISGHRPDRRHTWKLGTLPLMAARTDREPSVRAGPAKMTAPCRAACSLLVFLTASSAARAQQEDSTHAPDRFAGVTEARLDSLYGPLLYLMQADERGIYPTLSVGGKRDYLRRFWARRDPTTGTPGNELADEFYGRITEANRKFREGGAAQIPGWRTDRGRIFLKHGLPDEVLSRPQPPGGLPYEVWKYTRKRLLKYCFVDLTRFGNYALVWTNDRLEKSEPNWRQLLGWEAYEDVMRF